MKITTVTITGADDSINHADLIEISKRFPFVEWGILFSPKRQGTDRYPSIDWVKLLRVAVKNNDLSCSAHLCGDYSLESITHGTINKFEGAVMDYENFFKRIQLNFNCQKNRVNSELLKQYLFSDAKIPTILQYNKANGILCSYIQSQNTDLKPVHFLHDGSGGRGVLPSFWKGVVPKHFTGYAGGLNPDNLELSLKNIEDFVGENSVWIDAESGIRTDEKLDLDKVVKFIEISSKYVKA